MTDAEYYAQMTDEEMLDELDAEMTFRDQLIAECDGIVDLNTINAQVRTWRNARKERVS